MRNTNCVNKIITSLLLLIILVLSSNCFAENLGLRWQSNHKNLKFNEKIQMVHTPQGGKPETRHFNTHMSYLSWNNEPWKAEFNPNTHMFTHFPLPGTYGELHQDNIINYISWDGSEWTATYNPNVSLFTHTQRNSNISHVDSILNYKAIDGTNWTVQFQN